MEAQKRIDEAIRKVNDVCNPAKPCTAEDVWRLQNDIVSVRKEVKSIYDAELKEIDANITSISNERYSKIEKRDGLDIKIAFAGAIIFLPIGFAYLTVIMGKFEAYFFGAMLWPEIICFFLLKWLSGFIIGHTTPKDVASFDMQIKELYARKDKCEKQRQNAEAVFDGIKERLETERRRRYDFECRTENERRQALLLLQEQQKREEARRQAEEVRRRAEEAERRRQQLEEERRRREAEESARRRQQLEEDIRVFDEQVAACTEQMLEASEKPGALQDMVNQLTAEVKQAMKIGCEKTQAKWWFIFSVMIKDSALEYHILMPSQKEKPKIKTITYERIASEYKKFGLCEGLITLMKFNPLVGEDAEWTADVHDVCGAEALHKQHTVNNEGFTTTAVTSFKITYTGPNVNYEKPQSLY